MTDTLFEKLQAAYRRGVDFACWHFNTSEEKYMELWEFVPKAAYDYADKETGEPQPDKEALIRELLAALIHVRGLREQNRQNPEPLVEDALAKAKAAGFEP